MPVIDVHAHYFPPDIVEAFDRLGSQPVWPPHPDGMDERVAALEDAGIDTQVIGLGHNQPYFPDAAAAAKCAALANDVYADTVGEAGGRLAAFGTLPLPHVEEAVAEAKRCLDDLGFAGIGLGTSVGERTLDDPEFEVLWSELERRSATVFLHPVGTPPTQTVGIDAFMMGPKFGGPHELTIAGARLLMSGVTTRYPQIRFILAAGGGSLPYLWPRFVEMTKALNQLASVGAFGGDLDHAPRGLYYDTALSDDSHAQRFLIDVVGIDRLLLGTDAPRVAPGDWIERVRSGLENDEVDRVLGGNARTDLGL